MGAHYSGLHVYHLCAISGRGHCSWRVPDEEPDSLYYQRGHLIALAAGRSAMKKFGYRPLGHECDYDDSRLNERARKYSGDADQIITWARGEAGRIVNERWASIEYLAGVLQVFGDEMDEGSLRTILKLIPRGNTCEPLRHRRAFISCDQRRGLSPSSFDPETNSLDSVLSTGAAVRRQDWDGAFDEVLGMKPENVCLGRLNSGAAVLDGHRWSSISDMLGSVVPGSVRLQDNALTARIKFSRAAPLAQRVVEDLRDGIQIPLSLGYKVHSVQEDKRTNPVTRICTDWEPIEVSLVPVGAEASTGFRTAA
jgi:HK97 family phage prohead protease